MKHTAKTVQRTGASRFVHKQIKPQRRWAPVAFRVRVSTLKLLSVVFFMLLTGCESRREVAQVDSREAWPRTVDEAVARLTSQMSAEAKRYVVTRPEEDLILFHHGWGTGIRNEFGLWRGNTELLASCGSTNMHPDSASSVIIKATWMKLRQEADPEFIRKTDAFRATAKAIVLKAPAFEWTPMSNALAMFNTAAAEFHANHRNQQDRAPVRVVLSGSVTSDWPVVFENPEAKDASLYDVIRRIAINHGFEVFYEYPRIRIHRESEEPNS